MFEEQKHYSNNFLDVGKAKAYLQSIGEWDDLHEGYLISSPRFILDEANRIKANQIILTE